MKQAEQPVSSSPLSVTAPPPQIGVTNIKDNGHTRNPFFEIEGWVDEKVTLTINGEEVSQDQYKEFAKVLKLQKGPNKNQHQGC